MWIKPTNHRRRQRNLQKHSLQNRTVVFIESGRADVDIAQRIIDLHRFLRNQRQSSEDSHYIFIITPASVDISGTSRRFSAGPVGCTWIFQLSQRKFSFVSESSREALFMGRDVISEIIKTKGRGGMMAEKMTVFLTVGESPAYDIVFGEEL